MTTMTERMRQLLPRVGQTLARGFDVARTGVDAAEHTIDDATLKLLGPDFEKRLAVVADRAGPEGIDPFGLDPAWAKYAVGAAAFFHRFYFRTDVFGIEQVPEGRVMLVANHSGQIPLDGLVLGAAMFLDANPPRIARSMVEKWSQTLPFVSTLFQRVGQVVGNPENARRLLHNGDCVLVFPEGVRGISKPFSRRYRLAPFGLGFMRLALETRTPIVPVGVVGAEEQYVSLANLDRLARLLRVPSIPLAPQLLLPGGQLPLPVKYRLHFGAPMMFEGDMDDDDAVIEEKVLHVRGAIIDLIDRGLADRKSIFF
jgi:1-acyl-sn-glycerol-3-phosphate acyltransferase